jgi:hypothetical protein
MGAQSKTTSTQQPSNMLTKNESAKNSGHYRLDLSSRRTTNGSRVDSADEMNWQEYAFALLSDETPEGRSIVVLAKEKYNFRGRDMNDIFAEFIPFSAQTRMSGVDLPYTRIRTRIRKGSVEAIAGFLEDQGSSLPRKVREHVEALFAGSEVHQRSLLSSLAFRCWRRLRRHGIRRIQSGSVKR